jgi:hypothetical protein
MADAGVSPGELLYLARAVVSAFEGVAIEGIAELAGGAVEFRLSVPAPGGGQRRHSTLCVRRGELGGFAHVLRVHVRSALLNAWPRPSHAVPGPAGPTARRPRKLDRQVPRAPASSSFRGNSAT